MLGLSEISSPSPRLRSSLSSSLFPLLSCYGHARHVWSSPHHHSAAMALPGTFGVLLTTTQVLWPCQARLEFSPSLLSCYGPAWHVWNFPHLHSAAVQVYKYIITYFCIEYLQYSL